MKSAILFFVAAAHLSVARALQFSFTQATCNGMSFQYALDKPFEKESATTLLINYQDETISSFDITGKTSGTGSFQTKLITENSTLPFSIGLASASCDVLAQDGSCYTGNGQIDIVNVLQACTCSDNGGYGTDDANNDIPGEDGDQGANLTIGDDSNDSTATTAAVPDSMVSALVAAASSTVSTSSLTLAASALQTVSSVSVASGTIVPATSTIAPSAHDSANLNTVSTLSLCGIALVSSVFLSLY